MKYTFLALLLCSQAHATSFAFDITSAAGHHEYTDRAADACRESYINGDDVSIGCETTTQTQPNVSHKPNPQSGEGSGTILVAYLHTAAGNHPLEILQFDGCWLQESDSTHIVATCARSSDDGFVDGFEIPCLAQYASWCNKIIPL